MSLVSEGTLHCLSAAPHASAARRLLAQIAPKEPVLLLGKAVRLAASTHPELPHWIARDAAIYALDDDLQAYAVTNPHASVVRTSYADWVELSVRYSSQLLWR